MTAKQRVQSALARQPVDRVPIFMWFHPEMAKRLSHLLNIPAAYLNEVLGDDIRQTWVGNNFAMEGIVHEKEGETHLDDWGIEWIKIGPFNQIKKSPLRQAAEDEIQKYGFPVDKIEALLKNMDNVLPLSKDYFIGCDISPCLFEMLCRIRGMENAIYDLVSDSRAAQALMGKAAEFSINIGEAACDRFDLDWFWTAMMQAVRKV